MTAPSEQEIREAIGRQAEGADPLGPLVYDLLRPLLFVRPDERGPAYDPADHLWDNLRPSEAERLSQLPQAIYDRAEEWEAYVVRELTEAIVGAGLTFAQEYPDAPRASGKCHRR